MAHSLSARKRVRQIVRKAERNQPFRRRAANAVREVLKMQVRWCVKRK